MWMPANIRMDCYWVAETFIFAIEEVEVVPPKVFNVLGIDPAMGIWRFLDEHHRWAGVGILSQ